MSAVTDIARTLWLADKDDREWAEAAWDDMGGPEPSAERAELEARVHLALHGAGLLGGDAPDAGSISDGYHTFDELYQYRMLYNALAVSDVPRTTVKSWRHHDGEECFGGGWFIVVIDLPTGQVSNHYPARDWDLFAVPEVELAPVWDGHDPAEAARRIEAALRGER